MYTKYKWQELYSELKKEVATILKCKEDEIKLCTLEPIKDAKLRIIRHDYVEISELYWKKPDWDQTNNWSLGYYYLFFHNKIIASFNLYQMPHCCGIMVSCNANVGKGYTGKGLGTLLNTLRINIGKGLGYSLIVCTDLIKNGGQRRILEKNGWKDLHKFNNRRTGNDLYISAIDI